MLKYLFKPMSVAVIGASTDTTKLGTVILRNIIERGFDGDIYPINPNADKIMGLKAYPSISYLNDVQLVIIATSSKDVLGALKECAESGVRTALVFSSGFGELTDAGKKVEMEMVSVLIGQRTTPAFV